MNISKQSWHYRFNNHMANRVRSSREIFTTCSYVQHTLMNVLKAIFITLAVIGLVVGGLLMVLSMLFVPILWAYGLTALAAKFAVPAIYGYVVVIAWGINKLYTKVIKPRREESLLEKVLQDRKDGICSIVEFK